MRRMVLTVGVALIPVLACAPAEVGGAEGAAMVEVVTPEAAAAEGLAVATFAGGCFWCMEPPFDVLDGVISTTSGYSGGPEVNPTYKQVSAGRTGHAEVIRVVYDPEKIGYAELLQVFWHNIDPTVRDRQFCDGGRQYRTAIYTHGEEQHQLALESLQQLKAAPPFVGEIVTEIVASGPFWAAEAYHQDYYVKNPSHYKRYRRGCGRDARLEELWGDLAGGH